MLYGAYAKAPGFLAYRKMRKETFRPEFRDFIGGYVVSDVATWGALKGKGGYLSI